MNYLAVYGTLRLHQPNHKGVIDFCGRESMKYVDTTKIKGMALYSLGSIPAAVPDPEGLLTIDIFQVSPEAEHYIDILEGSYNKGILDLHNGLKPYIYYMPEPKYYWTRITDGDWVKYTGERQYNYQGF